MKDFDTSTKIAEECRKVQKIAKSGHTEYTPHYLGNYCPSLQRDKVGREKSLGLFVSWKQCDQIGCFRTVLGYKFLTKVAQIFADCF